MRRLLAIALVLAFAAPGLALEVPPPPKTRVTDKTGTLTAGQLSNLERGLAEFEQKTSNQIVVLIIPTLEGGSLEDFSVRLAEKWKPGQKGKDNGVILLIVKNDRKLRIEVGYGLEGALPDVLAGTIIRNDIAPRFRKGDFYGGILAGLRGIAAATRGEYKAAPTRRRGRRRGGSLGGLGYVALLFLLMSGIGGFRRRRLGYWGLGSALFLGMGARVYHQPHAAQDHHIGVLGGRQRRCAQRNNPEIGTTLVARDPPEVLPEVWLLR